MSRTPHFPSSRTRLSCYAEDRIPNGDNDPSISRLSLSRTYTLHCTSTSTYDSVHVLRVPWLRGQRQEILFHPQYEEPHLRLQLPRVHERSPPSRRFQAQSH
jgi:hypothetical protein